MREELKDEILNKKTLEEVEKRMFDIISKSFNKISTTTSTIHTKTSSEFSVEGLEDMVDKLKDTIIFCNSQDVTIAKEAVNKSSYSHRIEIRALNTNIFERGQLYMVKKEDMDYNNQLYMTIDSCLPLEIKHEV